MHYRFVSVIVVTINVMLHSSHSHMAKRTNRHENGDVFNLLLGLYKLNPLRSSQVYKSFSEGILSGHPDKKIELQFESNESNKKKVNKNLKAIEKVIHVKHKNSRRVVEKPEFDIQDVDTENFNVDIMVNDGLSRERTKMSPENDNFSGFFSHIGSNEVDGDDILDGDIPVTKLLPVNDTLIKIPTASENFKMNNDIAIEIGREKSKEVDKITSYIDIANDLPKVMVMTERYDTADVIVI